MSSGPFPFAKAVASRPRKFVGVSGPDAADYLQRMVSNDVAVLAAGESCEALLLTPKARVIAPLRVVCRGPNDYLLLTEPGLGETVATHLRRMRFAAKVDVVAEDHPSYLLLGPEVAPPDGALAAPTDDYGVRGFEVVGASPDGDLAALDDEALDALRIRAGTPRWGREIDDRVLPAEAGLVARAVSFSKGCYPGQEPIARLHYRGRANRGLRVLVLEAEDPPPYDTELLHEGKPVGRVTSAAASDGNGVLALAYVRREVPEDAELDAGGAIARPLHSPSPRP